MANDGFYTFSSANFYTNGTSYQRVCGRARGYQKENTIGFHVSRGLDKSYVLGYQFLTVTILVNTSGHLLVGMVKGIAVLTIVLALSPMMQILLLLLLAITIIVNQLLGIILITHIFSTSLCGMK